MRKKDQTQTGPLRVYRWLRFVLIPVVLVILGFSAYKVITIFAEYGESDESYRQIEEQFLLPPRTPRPGSIVVRPDQTAEPIQQVTAPPTGAVDSAAPTTESAERPDAATTAPGNSSLEPEKTPIPTAVPPTPLPEVAPIGVDFEGLKQMNSECIGWIYIAGTDISYPVLQTGNNSKYLDTLPNGKKNKSGSIFMDTRNDPMLSDGNTVIYGHNMQNGTMFSDLRKYEKRTFFDAHRTAYYLTPEADYKITIIACARVPSTGEAYVLYNDPAELRTYLRAALGSAFVSASVDLDRVTRIVTLSTCTGVNGKRVVLIGIPELLS